MNNYDFHSKDVEVKWSDDWEDYCDEREETKKKENWLPFLSFPITKKCNFKCLYCGVGGEATASEESYTSIEMIKEYVNIAIKKGINKIRITGGEPFLHPKIGEILSFLDSTGKYILVNTNGSLILKHESMIKKLSPNIKFAVSFDTLKSSTLKIISNVNCHKDVLAGIQILNDYNHLLRVNMVINKYNYTEVYDIINFCNKINCDLKILDVVSVPVPFSDKRQDFYYEVNTLEKEFSEKCDHIFSHEYSRGFGTPCYRYKFENTLVTIKNSKKGSHYDRKKGGICEKCVYYPCHEGLYDIFALSDGRLCSCRWTEKQTFEKTEDQMDFLIEAFKRAKFSNIGVNPDMKVRTELFMKRGKEDE